MEKKILMSASIFAVLLIALSGGVSALFSSAYGGDPGRDEIMFTDDDLAYVKVIKDLQEDDIEVFTVDFQELFVGSYAQDAHANFKYIAGMTDGEYYYCDDTCNLDTSVQDAIIASLVGEIEKKAGAGPLDVAFIFDLSASMSDDLGSTKYIANGTIDTLISDGMDANFSVGSHVDYNGTYTSYGYSDLYGSALSGDYPWNMDQDITDGSTAQTVINGLMVYFGGDGPQNYARALYESQFFSWRSGAKKVVVLFGDAPAHSAPDGLLDVEKDIVDSSLDDPTVVPELGVKHWWIVNITVEAVDLNLTGIVVKDRFGGEFEVEVLSYTQGTATTWTKGNSDKVFLEWNVSDLNVSDSATLLLNVSTDTNPGKGKNAPHQEFTSCGLTYLNSGATGKTMVTPPEDPEYETEAEWVTPTIPIHVCMDQTER